MTFLVVTLIIKRLTNVKNICYNQRAKNINISERLVC